MLPGRFPQMLSQLLGCDALHSAFLPGPAPRVFGTKKTPLFFAHNVKSGYVSD
jgi:hypothetical protein